MNEKIKGKHPKPRNALVVVGKFKTGSGPHEKSYKAKRNQQKMKLKKSYYSDTRNRANLFLVSL